MGFKSRQLLSDDIISVCNHIADALAMLPGIYARTADYFYCFKVDKMTIEGAHEVLGYSAYKWRPNEWFCNDHYRIFKVEMGFYFDKDDSNTPFQPVWYRGIEIFKQYPLDETDLEHAENMIAELKLIATHVDNGLVPVYCVNRGGSN